MSVSPEQTKRRGRPPLSPEEKKRHTMTFRMRTDLRAAVEELARAHGRSLSEQIEYYVESGFKDEAGKIYQYSLGPISSTISNAILGRETSLDWSNLPVKFTGTVPAKSDLISKDGGSRAHALALPLPWARDSEQREGALKMARALLHATRKGAVEALVEALGSEIVEMALAEEAKARQPECSNSGRPDLKAGLTQVVDEQRKIGVEAENRAEEQPSSSITAPQVGAFSISELVALITPLTARSPDLSVLWSSPWPRLFADLPADIRAAMIGALKGDAATVYETMMRSSFPNRPGEPAVRPGPQNIARGTQLVALRRMQSALLPRGEDEEDFGGPDEDGIDDDGPAKKGRA